MTNGPRKPGQFCWFDVMTKDLNKTKALFTKLFGWSYTEMPTPPEGTYTMAMCYGSAVGGISDINKHPQANGVPPHMGVHVLVKSADEVAKAVTAHGGKVLAPPFDVMDQGRMCSFADPTGAALNVWEPKRHSGTDVDPMKHGAPSWIELMTSDVDRAGSFYTKVLGWAPNMKDKGSYVEFKMGGESVAGMLGITKEMGPMPPHWGCYMTVSNIDQTAKDCAANSGKVLVPPTDVAEIGRFAVLQTSDGIGFSVITYASKSRK